jgi:hypothetical protein
MNQMEKNKRAPFWVVWNPDRGMPTHRRAEFGLARAEAERLAKVHPGQEFIVMQAVGKAFVSQPAFWVRFDDIPF